MPVLEVFDAKGRRRVVEIGAQVPSFTIGRDGSNDVQILEIKASRKHCQIVRNGAGFLLIDLKSSNGTRVNGEPAFSHDLADGDEVLIGKTRIVFRLSADGVQPASPPPAPPSADDEEDDEDAAALAGAVTLVEGAPPPPPLPATAAGHAPVPAEKGSGEGIAAKKKKKKATVEKKVAVAGSPTPGVASPAAAAQPAAPAAVVAPAPPGPPPSPAQAMSRATSVDTDEWDPRTLDRAAAEARAAAAAREVNAAKVRPPAPPEADRAGKRSVVILHKADKKYVVQRRIAQGGMGAILAVADDNLRRLLVMKVMQDGAVVGEKRVARFETEARITAALDHPNIVPIHDIGQDSLGRPFFTMKLVRGVSLGEILSRRKKDPAWAEKYPLRRLLELLRPVCHAVSFAHARGVVHRDLKPANLMIGDYGEVYVMDWGLAKVDDSRDLPVDPGERPFLPRPHAKLSDQGLICGTPSYMPPEQAEGKMELVDARADVYCLGATLYEILTGEAPFEGEDPRDVIRRVLTEKITDPQTRAPAAAVPAELAAVAMKALARDREGRYQTVNAFYDDVQAWLDGRTVTAKYDAPLVRAWKWIRRHTVLLAVLLVALIGVGATGAGIASYALYAQREASAAEEGRAADLFAQGKSLAEKEDFERAVEAFDKASLFQSSLRESAIARLKEAREALQRQREKKARALGDEGDRFRDEYRKRREEYLVAAVKERREKARLRGPEPIDSPEKRQWLKTRGQALNLRNEVNAAFGRANDRLLKGLALVQEIPALRGEFRAKLAALYWMRFQDAEDEDNAADMLYFRALVETYNDGVYTADLVGDGYLTVRPKPAEATVSLAVIARDADGLRLLPGAFERLDTPVDGRVTPMGSYLLRVEKSGHAAAIVAVFISRNRRSEVDVTLYPEQAMPNGYILIPGGRTRIGGDPDASFALDRDDTKEIADFCIARHETTWGEYAAYLNALSAEGGAEAAAARVPASAIEAGYLKQEAEASPPFSAPHPTCPVFGVSFRDADAYCNWVNTHSRENGPPGEYRLPRDTEWEKAARGADGRFFPWGNEFDYTFCNSGKASESGGALAAVGSLATDVSPYGVMDLAGNVAEWTSSRMDDDPEKRVEKGGSLAYEDPKDFRSTGRIGRPIDGRLTSTGFRVVFVPEKKR
ncbi:MAG: SUMF1/EgtB/PvdO family nonheme iron enzyme [Planctomycetes bacterium]|nr:SUMF1/EgtB/PvdO family nonheme iron enzyme [Planctomycetota bacterium]